MEPLREDSELTEIPMQSLEAGASLADTSTTMTNTPGDNTSTVVETNMDTTTSELPEGTMSSLTDIENQEGLQQQTEQGVSNAGFQTDTETTPEDTEEPLTDVVVIAGDNKSQHSTNVPSESELTSEDSALIQEATQLVDINENQVTSEKGKEANSSILDVSDDESELPWAMYRSLDPAYKKNEAEESEDWTLGDEEDITGPEREKNLPDIYALLESLEEDKVNLLNSQNIFDSEKQKAKYEYIDELKLQMADAPVEKYVDDFHQNVEDEILMIGSISLEDVQEEERRLRDEHIQHQQQLSDVQRERQEDILVREELAKKNVMERLKERRKALMRREEHLMQRDRLLQNKIHQAFRRSEHQLLKALEARKAEVKTMYGELVMADGEYGGSKGRRWKVDWNRSPQPVQVKLKCLRGIKDKLPAGRYVLMASLYDRLGGHVMKWSNLKGQQWGGATLPLFHEGEFYNIEVKIDQSVFTVCPARPDIRPGMILVFELFLLRGAVTPTDRVVAWGCFPICDSNFRVVEGKYKTPFLRGDMDPGIDTYQRMEELIADDIDHWLCNLYFDVVLLPRYMAGQKEYEVELQFTSNLLGHPKRTKTGEELADGEEPVYGSQSDLHSQGSRRGSKASSAMEASLASEAKEADEGSERKMSASAQDLQLPVTPLKSPSTPDDNSPRHDRPSTVLHTSRKLHEAANVLEGLSDDSGTDFSDEEVAEIRKQDDFKPVKGKPGMYYKKHLNNPVDTYHKKLYTMLPKTPLLSRRAGKKRKLTHLEELEQHTFSVKSRWSNKGRIPRRGREKMQYIGRQFLSELGLSQWRSREFWAMILMLILTWFIRIYAHYGGQWIYLSAIFIPINKFEFLPYTTNLNYQTTLLQTRQEISLVVLGPFTNIIIFCLMVFMSWLMQRLFGRFPSILSRFVMAYGINTLLDPVWILIVDTALKRYRLLGGDIPIGDAYKLYWHFDRYEKNGIIGIFITVFLYIVTVFSAATVLYMYFLRVHNSGRLLDVYHRLNGKEDEFFVPYDLEVSLEELTYISRKAEQWRGEEGERRKVAVYDYVWEEEELDDKLWDKNNKRQRKNTREITTHTSIHTLHLDGLRELYRHFLRLPDGAIVEVFGEMPLSGIDESVKQAILQRNTFENIDLVSSVTTLRSRRGSHVTGANGASFFGSAVPGTAGSGNAAVVHNAGSRRQSRVQFSDLPAQTLDLPGSSNGMPGGSSLV
ncbi:partial [Paramuricea clavata]|uniref:Partial n=1 Tax=Paramuricea clavata TaxID=317549 RepID=A0A6S7GPZ1_PARCT|nr:partial [Paramuricea clavata]